MIVSAKTRISQYLGVLQRVAYAHHNIHQKDVCKAIGLDESNYSKILTGVICPRIDTFLKIIDFFTLRLGRNVVVDNFAFYVLYKTT